MKNGSELHGRRVAKRRALITTFFMQLSALAVGVATAAATLAADAEGIELFEKRIRPLLAERCYECHGGRANKAKGDLRLDSREAVLKGGETGPAINLTSPRQSLLLKAISHVDADLKMPPKAKDRLTREQANDFATWIEAGAPFPGTNQPAEGTKWRQITQMHWAFQPVKAPPIPTVKDETWPRTPIDRFILAKLEENHLRPAPQADRRTLIRRATFDLHGLPPTPEEVEAFLKDESEDAFAKVIDRLLSSPRYGERWGRHWLDLARYSDTKGYVYGDREERFFVHAHAYRDWVIKAFNDDLAYDRFIMLQIAGDQMLPDALKTDEAARAALKPATPSDLAAIGFLTIGRRFLGVTHDIIDDRIDTLTRTTMGLTVSCARCHDHKFDPIPTADYYSLYGVFMNMTERTVPLATTPPDTQAYRAFEKELRTREGRLRDAFAGKRREWSDRVRAMSADYLLALLATDKLWTEEFYAFVQPNEVNPPFVRQWQSYLHRRNQAGFDAIFEPWHRLGKLARQTFAADAQAIISELMRAKAPALNARVAAALSATNITTMEDLASMYGKLLVDVNQAWRELGKKDANATELPDTADEAIRQVLYASDSPVQVPDRSIYEAEFFFDEGTRVQLAKLAAQIDQWLIQSPGATPHAVILEDLPAASRRTARVFRRGNPATPGKEVERQFLELLSGEDRKPFEHGAGRLDLARSIADAKNPLTARVIVNRIWQHHFGTGLVATPSDFGTRAAPPSHPQLLDHLAAQFVSDGWSIKSLHRSIMLSRTYQQSGGDEGATHEAASDRTHGPVIAIDTSEIRNPKSEISSPPRNSPSPDPANILLSHFPRHRLGFESMRDSLLLVSGELDDAAGGRPVDLFKQPFTRRRSIYGLVDRQFFPGELRIFDVASPDLHSPTRPITTIPQQALYFMNSPFVKERAQAMVRRITAEAATSEIANLKSDATNPKSEISYFRSPVVQQWAITRLYRHLYQRTPAADELALGLAFIASIEAQDRDVAPLPPVKPGAWSYGYGELDEKAGRVKSFEKLPHFTGQAWQGGPAWPDAKLGWVQLTAEGGHAGNDLKHAAIRRWTAPEAMTLAIAGTIRHEHAQGDGIRAFIVHGHDAKEQDGKSAAGSSILGSWTLHNQSSEANIVSLKVHKGDTIDFIVDIRGNLNNDDFIWMPVITQVEGAVAKGVKPAWSSLAEFAGVKSAPPEPLSAWEMYAQAMMLGNEFMFVD